MTDVDVRPLAEDDLDRCAELFAVAFAAKPYNDEWTHRDAYEKLHKLWRIEPNYAFCAEDESDVVGAIFARVSSWWVGDCVVIEEIFVHPRRQRQGIGAALFEAVETHAKQQGVIGMWLIANQNAPAMEFYKRHGLTEGPDVSVMVKQFPDCP